MSLNIFSLLPHLDNLSLLGDDEKPHIMYINETKLDSFIESLIRIGDYVIVRKDRNVHGDEVALYIHQNVQFELREYLICEELESITVQIKNSKLKLFFVTSIYRPPGKPISSFRELESLW